jgi:hypothetical protein
MAHATIKPGQTIALTQSFTFGGTATIDGGLSGGAGGGVFLTARDTLTATGTIQIDGGDSGFDPASHGGLLEVTGLLVNQGTVEAAGGSPDQNGNMGLGGAGGTLVVSGELKNAGTVLLDPGTFGHPASGQGSMLLNIGVVLNTGLLEVQGAIDNMFSPQGYNGAALDNVGTLTNEGALVLSAGDEGVLLNSGVLQNDGLVLLEGATYGSYVQNTGSFANTGTVEIGGGGGVFQLYGFSIGPEVKNLGTFTNTGVIDVQGGERSEGLGGGAGGVLRAGAGTLANSGQINLYGGKPGLHYGGGDFYGGGGAQLYVSVGAHLANYGGIAAQVGGLYADGAAISVEGVLNNLGDITLYGSVTKGGSALLSIATGGVLSLGAGSTIAAVGNFGTAVPVTNNGEITGSGAVDTGTLLNQGTIEAFNGSLVITSNITGNGILEQTDFLGTETGTLTLDGTVGSGQQAFLGDGAIITGMENAGLDIAGTSSQAKSILELTGGGTGTLDAADKKLTVQLAQASTLTLSLQGFLTVDGSSGADTIVALAAGQTLTGGLGLDMLTGSAATGDTFKDTSIGLNGDTIVNFVGTDMIDITDLAPGAGLMLGYTQNGTYGTLTVTEGSQSSTITLLGTFSLSDFTTGSDGHGGLLIGLH